MRPLTPEETASLRRELRWWKLPMFASVVFGALVLLSVAAGGPIRGSWAAAIPMIVTLALFNGGLYYGVLRPLRRDLDAGLAETISGPVESLWRRKNGILVTIAGKDILVRGAEAPAVGEQVSIDFLPRAKKALKVTKLGSTP